MCELINVSNHLFAELFTQVGSVLSSYNIKHAGPLIIDKTNPEFKGLERECLRSV